MQAATVAGLIAETIPIIATKNKSIPKVFIILRPVSIPPGSGSNWYYLYFLCATKIRKLFELLSSFLQLFFIYFAEIVKFR